MGNIMEVHTLMQPAERPGGFPVSLKDPKAFKGASPGSKISARKIYWKITKELLYY